jgi:hypothetical protein
MIRLLFVLPCLLLAGCPAGRDLPPPPTDEPKPAQTPACGRVFQDPGVHGGAGCCLDPSAGLLQAEDILSICGRPVQSYLGQTRDGAACRFHFQASGQAPGNDPKQTYVMVSRPLIPTGTPAPVAPDPLLNWNWKKIPLRDALGYQAAAASSEPGLLDRETVLWAGRGRRIVGLHVSKKVCDEHQAALLLQKAIDAVP